MVYQSRFQAGSPKWGYINGISILVSAIATLALTSTQSAAQVDAFADVLDRMVAMPDGDCRAGIVTHRIEAWQNGPVVVQAFETVDAIMSPMIDPIRALADQGCNSEFLWGFLTCTQLDIPDATHIVPRGVTADTDAEFIAVLDMCMTTLTDANITPR